MRGSLVHRTVALLIGLVVGCGEGERAPAPAPRDDDDALDVKRLLACKGLDVDKMPSHVPAAFLAAEDRRFYDGSRGSSIVRQIVNHLPAIIERCFDRKAGPEVVDRGRRNKLQAQLEDELTRRELLTLYLDHVYLGHGAYGVVAAARTYFGKELDTLTIGEAAALAGLAAAPTRYSPFRNLPLARDRRTRVLGTMRDDGVISEAQYKAASAEPMSLAAERK